MIENVDEAVIICDRDGCVVQMNGRALRLFECAGLEQAWRSLSDFADLFDMYTLEGSPIPPADWPLARAVRGEIFQEVEVYSHSKRTGSDHFLRCSGAPIGDPQGHRILAVLTLRQIQEPREPPLPGDPRLTSVFRASPAGIGLVSNRIMLDVNDRLCAMVGYRREELIGHNTRILYPTQKEWEDVGREHYGQIQERGLGVMETRWVRKDGEVINIMLSSTPLDPKDLSRGITFTALDITAGKKTANELQSIFTFSLDMICIADLRTGKFTKVNPAFERIFGYSEQELLNRPFMEFIHPDDAKDARWIIDHRLRQGEKVAHFENRFRCKDGSYRWLNWTSHPQMEQGLIYGIARDVTEQKRMEEALRFTQFAVDHTADGAFWMTEDARLCYVNEAACQALGYSREELLSKTIYDIDPTFTEKLWSDSWRVLQAKKNTVLETVHRAKDGREYPVEIRASYVEFCGRQYDCAFARDITERKQAEESLKQQSRRLEESERQLRTLMGNLPGIAYRCANLPDWPFEFVSEGCLALTGYAPKEITVGGPFTYGDLIHPEDRQRVWEAVQDAVQKDAVFDLEYRILTKDGAEKWVSERGRFVPSAAGPSLEGFIADITDRKLVIETLREKEYLLSESQRIGRIGTWSLDLAGQVLTWTPETYRLYGVSPEAFVPSSEALIGLLHPEDREAMQEWTRAALAGEHPDVLEFRVVFPDGSVHMMSGRGELIYADGGPPIRLVGTVQDVTEQKQAEAALRELSRKNEEALRVARMGHWEFDMATGTFTFNDQYYTLHGTSVQEAGGCRMSAEEFTRRYVHPDDAHIVHESIRKAGLIDDPDFQVQVEARILRTDGEMRWVTAWFRIEKDAQGRTIKLHGVNQDITERRYAEEALRRLNEHLESLVAQRTEDLTHMVNRLQQLTWELSQTEDRERKRIADLLHDDVQQMLAAARFHLNLLGTGTRSEEESRELICQIKQMLKDAIEKARNLSHELSPALYQVDLAEIMNWLACHMREKHGLVVRVEVHGRVESSSEPVKALLYKVVQELLFNVVKHAGVKEALIRLRRMGPYICVAVIDRGPGFKSQELEKTAGFGLLGIRERVQLLGGRMRIRSTPGKGSGLFIIVPDKG